MVHGSGLTVHGSRLMVKSYGGYKKDYKKSAKAVYKHKRGKLAPLMTEEAKTGTGGQVTVSRQKTA